MKDIVTETKDGNATIAFHHNHTQKREKILPFRFRRNCVYFPSYSDFNYKVLNELKGLLSCILIYCPNLISFIDVMVVI